MTRNDNEEKDKKKIIENFESILPELIEKARANEERMKTQYVEKLQSKLLDALQQSVSNPAFTTLMSNLSVVAIEEDIHVAFGTDSELIRDLLETKYTKLFERLVSDITGSNYTVTFVISQDDEKSNTILPKPSAFSFLFEGSNNEYDEEYEEYIQSKSLDELFQLAYGKEEYERQKDLYEKRKERPDYRRDGLNIMFCVMCGGNDVLNQIVSIPVNINGIVSVNVNGAKCSNPECFETYYNGKDLSTVREFERLINQQALNDEIKLMNIQSEDKQVSTEEAAIKAEKQSNTLNADQVMNEIISMEKGERIKLLEMLYYKHFDNCEKK